MTSLLSTNRESKVCRHLRKASCMMGLKQIHRMKGSREKAGKREREKKPFSNYPQKTEEIIAAMT